MASDGVRLHVTVSGIAAAPTTVVLCHGFTLDASSWTAQRQVLERHARVVTWDHRGHGRSECGPDDHLTLEQLGNDVRSVIEQTAPDGTVILVGHSMGGMSILALADQHPELFGTRISATALLASSATPLRIEFGLPAWVAVAVRRTALRAAAECSSGRADSSLRLLRELARLALRVSRACRAPATLLERLVALLDSVAPAAIGSLLPSILRFDKQAALHTLCRVDSLVMAAEDDLVIPAAHSKVIAEHVPSARVVLLPRGGHMITVDQADLVNQHIVDLVADTTTSRPAA